MTKLTDRRNFPTLLRTIRNLAQTVFKLEQKWDRSIEIGKKKNQFRGSGQQEWERDGLAGFK
jgi:hypothetical protein